MQEYVSDAIILSKQSYGELDGRYSLFTKKYGKVIGRAKSSRKITSKLSGHLEPGNAVKARFIEMGGGSASFDSAQGRSLATGMQIVDALKTARTGIPLRDLAALNSLLPEMDPDIPLWKQIASRPFSWANVLKILGWDPEGAACVMCAKISNIQYPISNCYFYVPRQEFFCEACASRMRKEELSLIKV